MTTAPFGNDVAKVDRYRAFWDRGETKRPMVGFTVRGWFPLRDYSAARAWPVNGCLTPDMVVPMSFLDDEERLLLEGEILEDDIFRGDGPVGTVIPWMSGILGSSLRILPESVLGEDQLVGWQELDFLGLNRDSPWFKKHLEFTDALVRHSDGRYPVSPATFLGPSDIFAELRGHTQSILDILDEPGLAAQALWRAARLLDELVTETSMRLPRFQGGFFDGEYQLWAPGPLITIQEDASGLYSPATYRQLLQPLDRYLASRHEYSLIHLHSSSMFILDALLEIEELKCFEINNDVTGPPLADMVPYFQQVQLAQRPLMIRGSLTPEDARLLMGSLEARGLYLLVIVEGQREAERLRPLLGM
jgi:hypothetical protein